MNIKQAIGRSAVALIAMLTLAPHAAADEIASVGMVMTITDASGGPTLSGCEFEGTGSCTFVCIPGIITAEANGDEAEAVSATATCGGVSIASCSGVDHCYGEGLNVGAATNGVCSGSGSVKVRCYSGTPGGAFTTSGDTLGGVNGSCDGFQDGIGVEDGTPYLPNGNAIPAVLGIANGCGHNGHIEAHVGDD